MQKSDFRLIAHRGNTDGPSEYENKPEYVKSALFDGFDVEIDVWYNGVVDGHYYPGLYLGHDRPQYQTSFKFLKDNRVWAHAKNAKALEAMLIEGDIHCFWHGNDDYTFTSKGYLWTYPGKELLGRVNKAIMVQPDKVNHLEWYQKFCLGICTDFTR